MAVDRRTHSLEQKGPGARKGASAEAIGCPEAGVHRGLAASTAGGGGAIIIVDQPPGRQTVIVTPSVLDTYPQVRAYDNGVQHQLAHTTRS